MVKKALIEHLDMDPSITLGVLCDQLVPPEEPMDEEELFIRDRLRSLVLSFITGEAKRAILDRHASKPESGIEEILVNALWAVGYLPICVTLCLWTHYLLCFRLFRSWVTQM